jgi:hypothetical protein
VTRPNGPQGDRPDEAPKLSATLRAIAASKRWGPDEFADWLLASLDAVGERGDLPSEAGRALIAQILDAPSAE